MIKIIINLLILLLLFSCSNKHSNSLDNLNKSFFKWHKKYSHDLFDVSLINSSENRKQFIGESFYKDIKRFAIELNQINTNRLSAYEKNDYFLLNRYLNNNIFNYEKIKGQDWNLVRLLDEIHSNILYLLILDEQDGISIEDFNNKLEFISYKINHIFETIRYRYSSDSYNEMIDYLLEEITFLINSTNIKILKNDLRKLKAWSSESYKKFDIFNRSTLKSNYEKYFSIELGGNIDIEATLKDAKDLIGSYENNIFNLSLPIYLSNNDEPVWTDYQDTLAVIDWMMSNLSNLSTSGSNCFNEKNILRIPSEFLSTVLDIEAPSLVESIYFRNSLITDKSVYLYDRDKRSFIALNYMKKSNPIQLYSNILNDLLPGDLFIEHSIKTSESLINQVYTNIEYSNLYKILMIDNYIDSFLPGRFNSIDKECETEHKNYSYMLDIQFNIDRIKNSISTISAINYHYYDISINESIDSYKYLNFFNEDEIKDLKIEIFGFGIDSIIKFKAYYLASNLLKETAADNMSEYLIGILKDNPNASFATIKDMIK